VNFEVIAVLKGSISVVAPEPRFQRSIAPDLAHHFPVPQLHPRPAPPRPPTIGRARVPWCRDRPAVCSPPGSREGAKGAPGAKGPARHSAMAGLPGAPV
jgi:hypothetical protein